MSHGVGAQRDQASVASHRSTAQLTARQVGPSTRGLYQTCPEGAPCATGQQTGDTTTRPIGARLQEDESATARSHEVNSAPSTLDSTHSDLGRDQPSTTHACRLATPKYHQARDTQITDRDSTTPTRALTGPDGSDPRRSLGGPPDGRPRQTRTPPGDATPCCNSNPSNAHTPQSPP